MLNCYLVPKRVAFRVFHFSGRQGGFAWAPKSFPKFEVPNPMEQGQYFQYAGSPWVRTQALKEKPCGRNMAIKICMYIYIYIWNPNGAPAVLIGV